MVVAIKRRTNVYVMKQTTFASHPTTGVGNAVLINNDTVFVKPKREVLERNVIRNTLSTFAHAIGYQFADGNIIAEVKGSGTQGTAPELDPLFDVTFGKKSLVTTASIVRRATQVAGGPNYATHIRIATLLGAWTVGNMIRVGTGSTFGVGFIERTRATALFLTPALPFTPTYQNSISKSVNYRTNVTSGHLVIDQYLDNIRMKSLDTKVVTLSMNIVANQLVNAEFSLKARSLSDSNESDALDPSGSYDTTTPPPAISCRLNVGGVNLDVENLEFTMELEIKERRSIRLGKAARLVMVGRVVSGSLDPYVEDNTYLQSFINGTVSQLIVEVGTTAGNIFAIRMPRIQYTDVDIADQGGEWQYKMPFAARAPFGSPETEVVMSFC